VFRTKGAKNIVIKLGKDGCYVKPEYDQGFYTPTYLDVEVIDTSGAGDAFCAGFLTGLAKGWDIRECARFANAVGTHCVMAIGTTTGIKTLEQIVSFMEKHK
jgi:sugar/nucleoside kinase (ribokinase family)